MMRMLRELSVMLFGWQRMQRQCFVKRNAGMKNYEEFKGYQFKLDYDSNSGTFGYTPLSPQAPETPERPILFRPKSKPARTPEKIRHTA
jgi:hypothetical protein